MTLQFLIKSDGLFFVFLSWDFTNFALHLIECHDKGCTEKKDICIFNNQSCDLCESKTLNVGFYLFHVTMVVSIFQEICYS